MAAQRSERLVNLVIALLVTDRPLTRAQLRDMIEDYRKVSEVAFQRSFERDKEELRRIGITVESVTLDTFFGDEVGYRIPRADVDLPPVQFTQAEADALATAARVWRESVLDESSTSALVKLRAAGVEPDTEAGIATQVVTGADAPSFSDLWRATIDRSRVRFGYRGGKHRTVDPWRMALRRGRWYLVGRDVDRDEPRLFRLSRISSAVTTVGEPGAVASPEPEVIEAHLNRLEPPEPEEVDVTMAVAPGVRLGVMTTHAEWDGPVPEGYEVVTGGFGGYDEAATAVLRAGGRIILLAPQEARTILAERINAVLRLEENAS